MSFSGVIILTEISTLRQEHTTALLAATLPPAVATSTSVVLVTRTETQVLTQVTYAPPSIGMFMGTFTPLSASSSASSSSVASAPAQSTISAQSMSSRTSPPTSLKYTVIGLCAGIVLLLAIGTLLALWTRRRTLRILDIDIERARPMAPPPSSEDAPTLRKNERRMPSSSSAPFGNPRVVSSASTLVDISVLERSSSRSAAASALPHKHQHG